MSPRPGPDLLLQMYATMLRIRRAEERARELYAAGRIPGFIHLSIGQEAVAAGVLPIVADHSGLAEVAAGLGENGLTFDGTAADLGARLAGVLALPDARRREMGLAARAAVVERWSWDGIAQRLIDASLS